MSYRALASGTAYSRSTWQRIGSEVAWEQIRATGEMPMTLGIDGKLRPVVRYDTTERDATIRNDRATGMSMRQLADIHGVSVGTVHRIIKSSPS